MSYAIAKSRRGLTRPTHPVRSRVDRRDPLTRGLVALLTAPSLSPGNALNGKMFEVGSAFSSNALVSMRGGTGLRVNGVSGSQTRNLILPTAGISTRSFTLFARLRTTRADGAGVGARDNGNNILLWRNSGAWDMRVGGLDYTQAGTYALDTVYDYAITSGPTAAKLFVNGEIIINGGAAYAGTLANLIIGNDPLGGGAQDVDIQVLGFYNRELSASEVRSVLANPYKLLRRLPRRVFVNLGAGGATEVHSENAITYNVRSLLLSDTGLAYYIRTLLSTQSGVEYAIRNAIWRNDEVGYLLRATVAQNDAVGYALRAAITKDDVEGYAIRELVTSTVTDAHFVRAQAYVSSLETYSVRASAHNSASATYDIMSASSVANNVSTTYDVRTVAGFDAMSTYFLRSTVAFNASSLFDIRAEVRNDESSTYSVNAGATTLSVYSDNNNSYVVGDTNCTTPSQIAAAVVAAMHASTTPFPSNITHINDVRLKGAGTKLSPWGPS